MSPTPIGPLLQTVFESILEVFLLCLAGYILAVRGVLDRNTQKQLNRLNVSIFTPSLLFSKVAFFLSPAKLRELWVIPIFFVITTLVSMGVAYFLGWILRLKRSHRSFAIAAAMFMNSNSLPIALMQSLVITVPGLKWGNDDNKDAMVGRALTYLVLYSTLGMMVRWSYGVRLLSQADPEPVEPSLVTAEVEPLIDVEGTSFPPPFEEQGILRHDHSSLSVDTDGSKTIDTEVHEVRDDERLKSTPEFHSGTLHPFGRSPLLPSMAASTSGASSDFGGDDEDDDGEDDEIQFRRRRHFTEPTSSWQQSYIRRLHFRITAGLHQVFVFMTMPLWAALLSLVVACIPPLQHALDEHVRSIKGALTMAGNCSIPVTLVVLGAYFYTPPNPSERPDRRSLPSTHSPRGRSVSTTSHLSLFDNVRDMFSLKRRSGRRDASSSAQKSLRPGETKTVIVAVLSRMILTPILLLPMMALSTRFDLQEVFNDPVFVVSNVLLIASPPALTLAQITPAASGDAFERLISKTIFWSYCVVTPPSVIIVVVIGLLLSKL